MSKSQFVGSDGTVYVIAEKPAKKKVKHWLWFLLTFLSTAYAAPLMPLVLLMWVLVSLETGRTNRKNGH